MKIEIKKLDLTYCDEIANILSSDEKLHTALTPNRPCRMISGKEYYEGCKAWELQKNGVNYVILDNGAPIGSISYSKKDALTARCGYWIKSSLWGKGYCTKSFALFLPIVKKAGFSFLTASIIKDNKASLKIWAKYTDNIKIHGDRYIPVVELI